MSYSITQLESLKIDNIENVFVSESRKLTVLTTPDHKIMVYRHAESQASLELLKVFKNHIGAVISVIFAPDSYHSYLLSVGYDKSLFLYNLDDLKQNEPVFWYTEEKENIGYFTCAEFAKFDNKKMLFVVGTSTGEVILFDSDSSFEPKLHQVSNSMIKSISMNADGDLLVASTGNLPTLYFNLNFENPVNLEENGQNLLKVSQIQFNNQNVENTIFDLFIVSEDQIIGIWEVNNSMQFAKLVQLIELPQPIINANWNISGLSISAFCGKKAGKVENLKVFRIKKDNFQEGSEWNAQLLEHK